MNLDPVLALLQVSTALGVLYLALPEARYRDKLFRQVVGAFKEQEVEDVGDENADVDDRIPPSLHRQTRFSDLYHKAIMTWREELPEHHDEKLEGTSAWYFPREAGRKPEEATERLPAEYQVFKSDTDIKVVFWVAVIAPILAMWALAVPEWLPAALPLWVTPSLHTISYVLAVCGQLCVGYYVGKGRKMVDVHAAHFQRALNDAVSMIEVEKAKSEIQAKSWARGHRQVHCP